MAANYYKPGELFRRIHVQNLEKNSLSEENTEEVDCASDNLSVDSDNQADLLNQAEVPPELTTTKRKASSDPNVRQPKSAKKSNKNPPKVRAWTPEQVELLGGVPPKNSSFQCSYDYLGRFRPVLNRY